MHWVCRGVIMKKICCLFKTLDFGGAEKNIVFVANSLAESNYDVTLAYCQGEIRQKVDSRIKLVNLDVVFPQKINKFKLLSYSARVLLVFRKLVKKSSFDLVISFNGTYARITNYALIGCNAKHIASERGNPFIHAHKYLKPYKKADKVIFQTQRARQAYKEINSNKVEIIPNPIFNTKRTIAFDVNSKTIVSYGRLHSQKRFDLLIKAFQIVSFNHPDYTLEIYGEGFEYNNLVHLIRNHDLNKKVFLRGLSLDISESIDHSYAFVMTSDYEGMPNALLEALSLGLPCISTNCESGGPKELLKNGERGILVDVGNVEGIAKAISCFIEKPEVAQYYSGKALEVNEEYAASKIKDAWSIIITETINSMTA